jgi:flagellar basal body-associated protein FliL
MEQKRPAGNLRTIASEAAAARPPSAGPGDPVPLAARGRAAKGIRMGSVLGLFLVALLASLLSFPPPAMAAAEPVTVQLEPFTTHLEGPSGWATLKAVIGLEVDDQAAADGLGGKIPDIEIAIIVILSSQSVQDLSTDEGKERLLGQILERVNSLAPGDKVRSAKYLEFSLE